MSNKQRAGNKQGSSTRQGRQHQAKPSRDRGRTTRDGRGRDEYDYDSNEDYWQSSGRYDRTQQDYDPEFRGSRAGNYGDYFGNPSRNYDWRYEEDRFYGRGQQQENRRPGYYPGEVDGNRNASRGEGYGGYGRQGQGENYRSDRYDEEDRFYRDRGYSRDMYARNDRSNRWDDDRRYYEEGYGGGGYPYSNQYENDHRINRAGYENMYGRNPYSGEGYRPEDEYGSRGRYANDERRGQGKQEQGNGQRQRKHGVVGRGMYGNHPSGRYGSYGGDIMHGNMGGGTWQGNNEYQVGGGVGYQPSDAGTYGSFAGAPSPWDEDQPPGRKIAATKTGSRASSENKQGRENKGKTKSQANRAAAKKNTGNKNNKRTIL